MSLPQRQFDAIVIGSGPNGLAAAITLAQAGRSVLVVEGSDTLGGGTRSAELTLPGFTHDVCSAVHPMALGSPFFRTLPLRDHGLEWLQPAAPLAHPFDDGTAIIVERSVEATAEQFGGDAAAYTKLMSPLVKGWPQIEPTVLGSLALPANPFALARFGLLALRGASSLARSAFRSDKARAVFAGLAAHSILPLEKTPSAAFGLVLAVATHTVGWPIARGGSQKIADALASYLRSLGGEIVTGTMVETLEQLPKSRTVLCDVTPRQLLAISGASFPSAFRRSLAQYRYGPGACKLDWALDGPIPWRAAECVRAATVHLGGSLEEIEASERAPWQGRHAAKPFVLLVQPALFDPSRAPAGKHIAWAYCHVPNGSEADMSEEIENQVERFAPGFRSRILKRSVMPAASLQLHNPNLVGGDVGGGAPVLGQLLLRPTWRRYRTPAKNIYICSAATPPGGGVHGMCGHLAARAALRDHPARLSS